MDERTPTAQALAGARSLLATVDHASRTGLDAESRLALVVEVVALARQVEALRAVLVGEADRAKAAETARGTSIRSLLAVSSRVTAGEAASWVYAGQDVTAHERVREATLAGDVSVAQARAIDKVLGELPATLTGEQRDRAEELLLDQACRSDAKALAKQTRRILEVVAPEVDAVEDELARLDAQRKRAWAARAFTFLPDGRGSLLIRGQLPVLEGEEFKRLVDAHTVSNRRAQELAADRHDDTSVRSFEQRTADGLIALVRTLQAARAGGSGAERSAKPTVVVTMSLDALRAGVEQAGTLTGGQQVTAGELRRLACDTRVIPVVLGSASQPVDVGREQRLVTPAIRTALEVRDQGCAFPGCTMPPSCCEAHHIIPWYLHGPTALDNLVLLCPHHHATVEPVRFFRGASPPARWQVHMGEDGHPVFTPPGRVRHPLPQTRLRNQRAPQPVTARPEHPPPEQPILE